MKRWNKTNGYHRVSLEAVENKMYTVAKKYTLPRNTYLHLFINNGQRLLASTTNKRKENTAAYQQWWFNFQFKVLAKWFHHT